MYDIEQSLNDQILGFGGERLTVIFTEAHDPRQIEAVCYLTRFIRPVLLASEKEVREIIRKDLGHLDANRVAYTLSETAFVDPASENDLCDELAAAYKAAYAQDGRKVSDQAALKAVRTPCLFGIMAVREGHADMVVGGSAHEPVHFYRPMIKLLQQRSVVCEIGVFVLPDEHSENIYPQNIVIFGDVGVNAAMTPEILAHVAVDTCTITRDIFPETALPRIHAAMISYSNHGSDEGPSPELVRQASSLVPDVLKNYQRENPRYENIFIEGEVKANVALSQRSAMYYKKGKEELWHGASNVIICPNLDVGNLLYFLYATRFPEAKKFNITSGIGFTGVDLAKDCTVEDILLGVKAPLLCRYQKLGWQKTPRDTFFRRYRVLAINPGSTSTKVSAWEGSYELFSGELSHCAEELSPFAEKPITAQFAFRKDAVVGFLKEHNLSIGDFDAVSARGGLLKPIPHGTYRVDTPMLEDLKAGVGGEHASNLGALIAAELTAGTEKPAFIIDPVVVDEAAERVKITGLKEIRRRVISHALNQIASARRYAEEHETFYESVNLIVCHLGGGISVGAHKKGQYIDVNNALNGEGPFTPERSGSLPVGQLIDLCFSRKYTHGELKKLNKGSGGLVDLLGTNDLRDVLKMRDGGDEFAALVFEALVYQISKSITALVPAFDGEAVDRVILTGGMARSKELVEGVTNYVRFLGCGVSVYPGENEMIALVKGALRVLQGKEEAKTYRS
ncbi:MAG: butyrate kinase [Spirochaetales bacterium]|nr:butyrate kinase [Spirochaetales bacterium]